MSEHGADASLEQIARDAGVGSGTVRRHFPTRHALLAAVFHDRVEDLCRTARDLQESPDPLAALLDWLGLVTARAADIRGLATALARDRATPDVTHEHCASGRLHDAGAPLVARAAAAGLLRPEVTIIDLLGLVTGIALATEHHPRPPADADRLLRVAIEGIGPVAPRP